MEEQKRDSKPSCLLNAVTASNLVATIDNYAYNFEDMDRMYEELLSKHTVKGCDDNFKVQLEDLLFVSIKMAFLQGGKFQKSLEELYRQ